MPEAAEELYQRRRLTVADYYRMGEAGIFAPGERVELVAGEILDMAPIGPRHTSRVMFLNERFWLAYSEQATVSVHNPLRIDEMTEVEPDLVLLRRRSDFYGARHPRPDDAYLVIEVSDASLRYDREVKVPLYARAGIPEVWIVDVRAAELVIHRRPEGGRYLDVETVTEPGPQGVAGLPGTSVDLTGLFEGY